MTEGKTRPRRPKKKTEKKIRKVCKSLGTFLISKNRKYGDSILHPENIFSKKGSNDLLYCRIDDKLKRIKNSKELRKNDVIDLIGYLIWVCVKKDWIDFEELID